MQQFFVRGIIILKWYKSEVKCWASLCLSEEMEGLLSTIIQNGVMGIYRFCIDADNTNNTYTIHSIQLTSSVLRIQNVLQSSAHMALQWSEWLRVVKLRPLPQPLLQLWQRWSHGALFTVETDPVYYRPINVAPNGYLDCIALCISPQHPHHQSPSTWWSR